jgi:hypothetical protein
MSKPPVYIGESDQRQGVIKFIVFQGIITGRGLQALVQIVYQILDKTRNVDL